MSGLADKTIGRHVGKSGGGEGDILTPHDPLYIDAGAPHNFNNIVVFFWRQYSVWNRALLRKNKKFCPNIYAIYFRRKIKTFTYYAIRLALLNPFLIELSREKKINSLNK